MKLRPPTVTELLMVKEGPFVRAKVVFDSDDGLEGIIVQLLVSVSPDESLESIKSRALVQAKSLLAAETSDPELSVDVLDELSFEP